MPTNQPNNAPDTLAPADDANAASVLADQEMDETGGGGGLLGATAADRTPDRAEEGATPSNPASPAVAGDTASVHADAEARAQSETPEPHPSSL